MYFNPKYKSSMHLFPKYLAGSQESGAGSQEPGAGSQEPGAGSREPGVRSRESGVRSNKKAALWRLFLFLLYKFRISYRENKPAKFLLILSGVLSP
jgi:hypothetical protein